jgi:hypothetical protein
MTFAKISSWFEDWEEFALAYEFTTEQDGSDQFSWEQQRHIINLDETNFSLDGSEGGWGGCPSQSFTVAWVSQQIRCSDQ